MSTQTTDKAILIIKLPAFSECYGTYAQLVQATTRGLPLEVSVQENANFLISIWDANQGTLLKLQRTRTR
jgi:hypothetical protein